MTRADKLLARVLRCGTAHDLEAEIRWYLRGRHERLIRVRTGKTPDLAPDFDIADAILGKEAEDAPRTN